jgi:hypothetical protein
LIAARVDEALSGEPRLKRLIGVVEGIHGDLARA